MWLDLLLYGIDVGPGSLMSVPGFSQDLRRGRHWAGWSQVALSHLR